MGRVHREVGVFFGDRDLVGVDRRAGAHRDVSAGLDDAVEGAAIDDQVAEDREGVGAPGP
jgi:hypothetical protein